MGRCDLQIVHQLGLAALDDAFLRGEAMRSEALGISLSAPSTPPAPVVRAASSAVAEAVGTVSPATVFAGTTPATEWRGLVAILLSNYQPPDPEAEAVTESTAAASSSDAASPQEGP